jgi:methylaspartate ammonia-lyase
MIIKDAIAVKGYGGSFWKDQEAIKTGAKKDGFVYFGSAVTPGFYNIYQPSEAVSIVLFLEGDRIALGDCCSVTYSGKAGRDPLFLADYYQPFIEKNVLPLLIGREITHFKEMAEEFDLIEIGGQRLHSSIRYGVTQALLDTVAQDQKKTMAEVIAEEYGTDIPGKPVPIFTQSSGDWYMGVDKAIMRRSDVFPHANINTLEELEKLSDYIEWTRKRIQKLAGDKYRPYLHYDIYGSLAMKCDNDISNMLKHLRMWQDTAKPYKLIIEEPFDMKSPKGTIEMAHKLIKAKRDAGINVIICADEWCNTLDEIKTFVDNEAAEMIQIKSPDVGGINNIIEAILYCKKQGVYAYLGGSCCETDVSSRVTWHIALATEPFQTLAKPGLGVDESYQIGMNEMNRTLALIRKRLKK